MATVKAMATCVEHSNESVQCGYCLREGDHLVDPRTLPCNHICCYPCLVGDFDTNNRRIVRCEKCRKAFDVTLARLPSALTGVINVRYCDSCIEKGTPDQRAVRYCTTCNRKMCSNHDVTHQDFLPKHREVMDIEEYNQNFKKLEVRNCTKHEDSPTTMGCTTCYSVLCIECMGTTPQCTEGSPHQPVHLGQLFDLLKTKKDTMKRKAQVKQEKLSGLLKHCTRVLSDYEMNTDEMIQLLHNTRDEQLAEVRSRYDKLEKELSVSRRRTRDDIVEFMEREIGVRLTEINTLLVLQDVRFRDAHQADVLSSFAKTTSEIRRLTEEKFPSLIANQIKLQVQDVDSRMKILLAADVPIRISEISALPMSLILKNVAKGGMCRCVTSCQGITFIGCTTKIVKADGTDFITLNRNVFSVYIYKERLYILTYKHGYKVQVFNMVGKEIVSWDHDDRSAHFNKLTVTADKVVVPDRVNKQLTVYSLDESQPKHIPCPPDGTWTSVAICTADNESVVVSSTNTSTVFRVNIDTGEVMWTCTDVTEPGGVTCYGEGCVLVAATTIDGTEISILDATTGKYLRKLTHARLQVHPGIHDLHVTGSSLVVLTRGKSSEVLFFELLGDSNTNTTGC